MDNFSFGVSEVLTQNSRVETPSSNGILLFTRNCNKGTEKVPQSARLTEGDGGGICLDNVQIDGALFRQGLPYVKLYIVKVKGLQVAPAELEDCLRGLDGVCQ